MKRFHVHVSVDDLAHNIRFYSDLFGQPPAVEKSDYAKWMLEDPRVNFAISRQGAPAGLNHLGLQVDSDAELGALHDQLTRADAAIRTEKNQTCCYAQSDKHWVTDPQGIPWGTFHTLAEAPVFGGTKAMKASEACCVPAAAHADTVAAMTADGACCTPAAKAEAIKAGAGCCG
jgi:catechol 2,3-dioxygenase-like lactoylglutathione lyase family enzyme